MPSPLGDFLLGGDNFDVKTKLQVIQCGLSSHYKDHGSLPLVLCHYEVDLGIQIYYCIRFEHMKVCLITTKSQWQQPMVLVVYYLSYVGVSSPSSMD